MGSERDTIATNITKVAQENGLKLHPGRDSLRWADLVITNGGGCPCVPGRDRCPCELVLVDINELGRCRCGLFVNDAYLEEYNRLRGKR